MKLKQRDSLIQKYLLILKSTYHVKNYKIIGTSASECVVEVTRTAKVSISGSNSTKDVWVFCVFLDGEIIRL